MHYTLSVKCTDKTKLYLDNFFETYPLIQRFKKYGVVPNPSWFFKFSACIFFKNINSQPIYQNLKLSEFAYDCHYVNQLDNLLESVLKK